MKLQALSFAFLMIVAVSSAWGTDAVSSPESGAKVLVLKPVVEQHEGTTGDKVIGGKPARPGDYSVSFQLTTDQGTCTWFLIGARALMTAAHCVSDDAKISIKKDDQTLLNEGQCKQAPGYRSKKDKSQDWALCLLSADYHYQRPVGPFMPSITGYEVISTESPSELQGKSIQITGFGCTNPGGELDDEYRIGQVDIDEVPPSVYVRGVGRMPNYLQIKKHPSQLCGGDSGGPAFEIVGSSPLYRRVIGINSRTINNMALGVGYLASTSTKDALDFFKQWAKEHDQKICGLHKDAKNCRPTKP